MLAVLCVVSLAACGGTGSSTPSGPARANAHLVELADAVCSRVTQAQKADSSGLAAALARLKNVSVRFRAQITADSEIPRVGRLNADLAALKRLRTELRKVRSGYFDASQPLRLVEDVYQRQLDVYADARALRLPSCIGPRPRKPIGG